MDLASFFTLLLLLDNCSFKVKTYNEYFQQNPLFCFQWHNVRQKHLLINQHSLRKLDETGSTRANLYTTFFELISRSITNFQYNIFPCEVHLFFLLSCKRLSVAEELTGYLSIRIGLVQNIKESLKLITKEPRSYDLFLGCIFVTNIDNWLGLLSS